MFDDLSTLRQAGFFKEFNDLSDAELIAKLRQKKRNEHAPDLGFDHELDSYSNIGHLLAQDDKKYIHIDLETDVALGNNIYISIIETFSNASDGHFLPTNSQEIWQSDEGPIQISFSSNGEEIGFELAYYEDWLDEEVFTYINKEMRKMTHEQFFICVGPNEEWTGQTVVFIRLNDMEKHILEDKLKWIFPKDDFRLESQDEF
ncbi:hypothetical protein [Spirosoma pomorum]